MGRRAHRRGRRRAAAQPLQRVRGAHYRGDDAQARLTRRSSSTCCRRCPRALDPTRPRTRPRGFRGDRAAARLTADPRRQRRARSPRKACCSNPMSARGSSTRRRCRARACASGGSPRWRAGSTGRRTPGSRDASARRRRRLERPAVRSSPFRHKPACSGQGMRTIGLIVLPASQSWKASSIWSRS